MIAVSEGTKGIGEDGYNVLVGSSKRQAFLFTSYADHPRIEIKLNNNLSSTAAGRYQILRRYYDAYKTQLGLPDFSPDSQDKIAIQLIRECGALDMVGRGKFDLAVEKCRSRWASLPGAGYGQRENSLAVLRAAYINAGGTLNG